MNSLENKYKKQTNMNKRFNLTIHTSTNTKYFSSVVFRKVQIQRRTVCLLFLV